MEQRDRRPPRGAAEAGRRVLRRPEGEGGHGKEVRGCRCAYSPDGKWIAAGAINGMLRIWEVDGLRGRTFSGDLGQVLGLAFTPDSKQLISSSVDGAVRVWDVVTGLSLKELKGHPRG